MNFIDELIGKMYLTQNYKRTLNGIIFFQYYLMEKIEKKRLLTVSFHFNLYSKSLIRSRLL